MSAGKYDLHFEWLRFNMVPDAAGQTLRRSDTPTSIGHLWGCLEEITSTEGNDFGGDLSGQRATIRVRQFPDVKVTDRLRDPLFNEVWEVESLWRNRADWEYVLTVRRDDSGRYN